MRGQPRGRLLAIAAAIVTMTPLVACEGGLGVTSSAPGVEGGVALCGARPEAGCACEPGQVIACFPAEPLIDEASEPYCLEGLRTCDEGRWSECRFPDDAQRLPIVGDPELCGGCDPACWRVHDCPSGRDLEPDNADNVRFDLDADGIILGGNLINARYAYVANDPASTVSKIDLGSGAEVGRYLVGLRDNGTSNRPSRTALDSRGNAYVASRAFGLPGAVTKIAGDDSYCYDRNMNGVIDTSTGGADVRPWNEDECVLWTVGVGGTNSLPRALAIDAHDQIWVGLYNLRRFDVLDSGSGALIRSVGVSLHPYGAAIGRDGRLWFPNDCCSNRAIQSIDTASFAVGPTISRPGGLCDGSYGIAVDTSNRVLVGGWPNPCLSRYDPATNSWAAFTTSGGGVRGVTVDALGRVWAAHHVWGTGPHWMTSWEENGSNRRTYTLQAADGRGCGVPIGVGADFSGRIWTPCQSTSRAARLDPDTGTVDLFPVGANPYTYSDFTGFLRATVTAPEGSYTRLYDSRVACTGDRVTFWDQLYWEAETPAGTQIDFVARTASRVEQLGMSPEMVLASIPGDAEPADVEEVLAGYGVSNDQRYMEIRVRLRSLDGTSSPIFRQMDNVFYCVCACDLDRECTADCDCDEDCG